MSSINAATSAFSSRVPPSSLPGTLSSVQRPTFSLFPLPSLSLLLLSALLVGTRCRPSSLIADYLPLCSVIRHQSLIEQACWPLVNSFPDHVRAYLRARRQKRGKQSSEDWASRDSSLRRSLQASKHHSRLRNGRARPPVSWKLAKSTRLEDSLGYKRKSRAVNSGKSQSPV